MKTLLFTIDYPPFKGGVGNYYYNLKQNWPEPDDFKVLFKKYLPNPLQYFLYFQDLYQTIRSEKINYILVGQILPLGSVAYLYRLLFRTSYAVFLHGMDFPLALASSRKRFLTRRILNNSHRIICANNYVAKLVRDFSPKLGRKIIVVNPGVGRFGAPNQEEIVSLKERYNLNDKKIIITIGRLVKRKGVDMMFSALEFLGAEKISDWRYVILGVGPDEEYLKELCRQKGLADSVIFIGEVNDADKSNWLYACDLLAMPARNIAGDFEGFGIVYLEANLAGKAVLAGESGGVPDAVSNGLNGLLVDPSDVNDISLGLEKLMNNDELRETLGKRGQLRAKTEFDWSGQAQKIYLEIKK